MTTYWDNKANRQVEVQASYPPNHVVCEVSPWTLEDVYSVMIDKGIPVTDANVNALLGGRFAKDLNDRETEAGFEIISYLLDDMDWPER